MKRMSIADIAKELNISITTVSFILNGKAEEKRISKALTNRVMKRVKEIGFIPNQLAKSLRTGRTNIIGLIVEDISNPFFANVARLIEENANKRGYKIFYCSSENNTEKTKELIKLFKERQVDGYIITPTPGIEADLRDLIGGQSKIILFDRFLPRLDTSYVVVDNYAGAFDATHHLIKQGYEKIAIVTLDSTQTQMKDRLTGYKNAMVAKKLDQYIKKVRFHDDPELIITQIADFLKSKPVEAVFFATNYLGISGLEAIKRLRLRIPEQIGVVSFDDHDLFRLYTPSITVVAQPVEAMSQELITILLDHLDEKKPGENKKLKMSAKLIVRESSIRTPVLVPGLHK